MIGERELEPIPGYASATTPGDLPNWSLAVQPFDPATFPQTSSGNVYLRFWVAVWMEDAAGNLVPEMAGHGLAANPAKTTINTLGDVRVEPYSNNVGSFKQVFYVQGPTVHAQAQIGAAEAPPTFTVSSSLLATPLGSKPGKHQVSVMVSNGSSPLSSLQLVYYDGDPAHGGRAFEWEMIRYVEAGSAYVNRVTYTALACGIRSIYVIVKTPGTELSNSTRISAPPCQMILPWISNQ